MIDMVDSMHITLYNIVIMFITDGMQLILHQTTENPSNKQKDHVYQEIKISMLQKNKNHMYHVTRVHLISPEAKRFQRIGLLKLHFQNQNRFGELNLK